MFLAVVVMLVLLGAYLLWSTHRASQTQNTETSPAPSPASSSVHTRTIEEEERGYTVDAKYPQFGTSSIDAQIKTTVQDAIAEFKKFGTDTPPFPDHPEVKNTFTAEFDSAYVGKDVVSVRLTISEYTGGAHGNMSSIGMNFDRVNGKRLTLDSALKLIGKTLPQLSQAASAELKQRLGDAFILPGGASAKPGNFDAFLITADDVIFIFQEYQVAAFVEGQTQISYPRKK